MKWRAFGRMPQWVRLSEGLGRTGERLAWLSSLDNQRQIEKGGECWRARCQRGQNIHRSVDSDRCRRRRSWSASSASSLSITQLPTENGERLCEDPKIILSSDVRLRRSTVQATTNDSLHPVAAVSGEMRPKFGGSKKMPQCARPVSTPALICRDVENLLQLDIV